MRRFTAQVRRLILPHVPPRTPRPFSLVIFFSVCAVAGYILQRKVVAQSAADESQLRDINLKSFTNGAGE